MPPSELPWPPMYLVSEWTTMSAPHSIGLIRDGVETVVSTITGTPWLWAISAMASMSAMLPAGLPMDSRKTAAVLSSMSFSSAAGLSSSAKRTSMPWPGQHVGEERVGAAVELRHRDDVVAGLGDGQDGVVDGRRAGRQRQAGDAALERRHALLEHVRRSGS